MTNTTPPIEIGKAANVRCYIPTESKHYNGPDERIVVEWSEYPPNWTPEIWDEQGPDCLLNLLAVVSSNDAQRIAKEKASGPNNYGGYATIHRQTLDIYAHDAGSALGHWEYFDEGEEIDAEGRAS